MKGAVKLSGVIEELVEEKGLDREVLSTIICESMLAAYIKKYPDLVFKIDYDKKADEISISVQKEVVSAVKDEEHEISLRKARFIDKKVQIADKLWQQFTGKIGRIEILKARQIIASKIRKIETEVIYNEFKEKENAIIHGVIHKCERNGTVVKIKDTLAFLPKSLSIPGDKCMVGFPLRALLKEVLSEPRNDNQLILDRTSSAFLHKLFELEIPEVFEKLVEVKKIARIPGYKSKVAVISNDQNIDPVGTCVGIGGGRIKPILKELGGEKIDIIAWSDSLELWIKGALKPAEINRVELVDDKNANVWLDEDQRSLAIGKMGQNIILASKLTGVSIHLQSEERRAQKASIEIEEVDE